MNGSKHRPRATHLLSGNRAESLARRHLERQGLKTVKRNHRCRQGEIDLIMLDAGNLVFVEVRYRARENFGTAAESIDQHKIERLRLAAHHFLQHSRRYGYCYCRFDVIAIHGPLEAARIDWIKDAF